MPTSDSPLPDLPTLTRGLTSVLADAIGRTPVTVVDRQPCRQGTFPKEIVTCRCTGGNELRLFCKYGSAHTNHNCHGHRGGVAYEAEVYRQVLSRSQAPTPRCYGALTDDTTSDTWLILDYLDRGVRVTRATAPGAVTWTAQWIGRFHAEQQMCLSGGVRSFLTAYDLDYYHGWARRTDLFAGHLHGSFGWLATLCQRFERAAALLAVPPLTVIHGEYYPARNILYRDEAIYPIDWESAAIAPGEIDLATLTEGWPAEVARDCQRAYQFTRWPEGPPADFERRLDVARLYLTFRWLGEKPEATTHERNLWRFQELRSVGERLGLI